jgi:hypothetical protein
MVLDLVRCEPLMHMLAEMEARASEFPNNGDEARQSGAKQGTWFGDDNLFEAFIEM